MDSADQAMESQVFQEPNPHDESVGLLFEYLTNENYKDFEETMVRVGWANTIAINYVFPEKDKTILDIACTDGLDEFVQLILNLGADPNKVNDVKNRTPLHFAAEAGSSGALKILLTHPEIEPNLKVDGKTALHLAVNKEKVESVKVLLKYNANTNIADSEGLTPLHVAVMTDQEEIVSLLILKKADVRCVDNKGNTALHYAAEARSSEIISMLLAAGSYIGHKNVCGIPPIAYIAPETMLRYLDECLKPNDVVSDDFQKYEIEFDYHCLAPHVEDNAKDKKELDRKSIALHVEDNEKDKKELMDTALARHDEENERDKKKPNRECLYPLGITNNICMEMQPFLHIAKSKSRRHLLQHPILSSFLYLKWQRISRILWVNFIFYCIFYILLNSYILSITYSTEGIKENKVNTTLNTSIANVTLRCSTTSTLVILVLRELVNTTLIESIDNVTLWYSTTVALVILFFLEMVQLFLSRSDYILDSENWLKLVLISFSIAVLGGAEASVGALTILLSTCELIRLIGQYPRMSTAIEMFKAVTKSFLLFFFLYAPLILAFALAFHKLFKDGDKSSFPDFYYSLFKTVVMLTGEFNTDGIPFDRNPIQSHLVFVLFVLLIAIVLLNLLNGLAISDTTKILSEAELVGLISRTKLVAYAESIYFRSPEIVKNKWWVHLNKFIDWINPLRFLSKNKSPVFDVLPIPKIQVRPRKNNAILCRDRKITNYTELTMDGQIITHAENIISRNGRVSDYWKILNTVKIFSKDVDKRFDKIEKLICNFNKPEKENSNNNNYKSD